MKLVLPTVPMYSPRLDGFLLLAICKNASVTNDSLLFPKDILSEVFDVKPSDIKGNRRTAYVAMCRQIVMYILRKELELPLERVAKEVNRKDHTTVLHAYDKIAKKIENDSRFGEKIKSCLKILRD